MKWAKTLQAEAHNTPWAEAFIDYRALKKLIRQAKDSREVDAFFAALREEMSKANAHTQAIRQRVQASEGTGEEHQALLRFVAVNETSVRKIQKKLQKRVLSCLDTGMGEAVPQETEDQSERIPRLQPAFPDDDAARSVLFDPEPECFVCCSAAPPLYRPCKCSTLVHEACLTRLCKQLPSYKTRCAVCHEPYTLEHKAVGVGFVESEVNVRVMAAVYSGTLGILAFWAAILAADALLMHPAYRWLASGATSALLVAVLCLAAWLHLAHHRSTGRWWPFALKRQTEPLLKLPQPEVTAATQPRAAAVTQPQVAAVTQPHAAAVTAGGRAMVATAERQELTCIVCVAGPGSA